jgi:hypothetical protein
LFTVIRAKESDSNPFDTSAVLAACGLMRSPAAQDVTPTPRVRPTVEFLRDSGPPEARILLINWASCNSAIPT